MDFSQSTTTSPVRPAARNVRRRTVSLGGNIGNYRHARGRNHYFRQFRLQFRLRAGHERRVICAGHRQRDGALGAFGFGQFNSLPNFVRLAGNDELAGTIQIRQHHPAFGGILRAWVLHPGR